MLIQSVTRLAKHTDFRFKMECNTGRIYAAVLPEPVFALASTSRPSNAKGIAFACTGVGAWKFCFEVA